MSDQIYDTDTKLACPKCGGLQVKKPTGVLDTDLYVPIKCPACNFEGRRFGIKRYPTNTLSGL